MRPRKAPGYLLLELLLELGLWMTGLVLAGPALFQLDGLARRTQLDLATQTTADTLSALQQRNLFLTGHHLQFIVTGGGVRAYAWRDLVHTKILDLPRLGWGFYPGRKGRRLHFHRECGRKLLHRAAGPAGRAAVQNDPIPAGAGEDGL